MRTMTVTEAARHFSDLISRVHYRGESALLVKGGKPMAKVLPARKPRTGRELASIWGRLPHLSAKEAEAFAHDVDNARRNLPPLVTKWD
jgi:prevent-host-death family protein